MHNESQVRRSAARAGLRLTKSRTRHPYTGEAVYQVTDPSCSNVLLTDELGVTLEEAALTIQSLS